MKVLIMMKLKTSAHVYTPASVQAAVGDLEHILSPDLKMWAKSVGQKFLDAEDKIKILSTKGIAASAFWDKENNIVIISEDGSINETYN